MDKHLIKHDLVQGLRRKRYLFLPLLFLIPFGTCCYLSRVKEIPGTFLDFLISGFAGIPPVEISLYPPRAAEIPIGWLMSVGGCLYLNLDYILYDLMESGQQVIVRTGRRTHWFLSKCIWNVCSCILIFGAMMLMAAVLTVTLNGELNAGKITQISEEVYRWFLDSENISVSRLWLAGVLIPFLTVAAMSMLQMTLCLYMKPVFSFLICLGILGMSTYISVPWVIGNGAMGIRLILFAEYGTGILPSVLISAIVFIGSIIAGLIRFKKMNILENKVGT